MTLRSKFATAVLVAVSAAFLPSGGALAQEADARGLVFGWNLMGYESRSDSSGTSYGAGLGLNLGYGIVRQVSTHFRIDYGVVRDRSTRPMGHADIALRLSPVAIRRLLPFAEAAFTARGLELPRERMLLSTGATYTVGAEWYMERNRSLDVSVMLWQGGREELRWYGRRIAKDLATHPRTVRVAVGYRYRPVDRVP